MDKTRFHPDFREFLQLLNSNEVKYLLVGGYAVGVHGYPRATGDMDVWIAVDLANARKTAKVLHEFGMPDDLITDELFLEPNKVVRMGHRYGLKFSLGFLGLILLNAIHGERLLK